MKIVEIGVNGMFYAMSGQNFIAKSLFLPYNIGNRTIISLGGTNMTKSYF